MENNKRKRRRKKKSILPLVLFIVLIIAALIVTFTVKNMTSTDLGLGSSDEIVSVDIPEGSNVNDIAHILEENGVIDSAVHFKFLCKLNNEGSNFKFGSYNFIGGSEFEDIVNKLNSGDAEDNSIHITVKEGMWLSEIAQEVAEEGLCTVDEFMAAANSRDYDYDFVKEIPERENLLEGYLYPETYYFMPGTSPNEIVDTMLNQFDKVCNNNDIYSKVKNTDKSLDEIVIIASLIESEVKYEDERPLVSSVIYNRLKDDMKLQIDASVLYSLGKRGISLSTSQLGTENEHNTYYVKGLPAGPICSPRVSSLAAAAEPSETDYIYYVVENTQTGQHYFTADYDDFLNAKERYKNTLK